MKMAATLLAGLAIAASAATLPPLAERTRAQPAVPTTARYVWRNATVGAGGFAPNIIFSVAERDLAYLRTDMGGAYRWDGKAQRWIPLQDGMRESSYMGIESLAPDPVDPEIVYIAAGMYAGTPSAILRSADRGATWTVAPVSFRMGGNEDGRGLGERLAVDPNRTSTLFYGSRHDGLWRSDDSGASWARVESFPLPGLGTPAERQPTHGGISFVIIDPASSGAGKASQTIFAGVADPGAQHLFRSDDGGRSWSAVPGGPPQALLPVKAAIDDRGMLFLVYCNGIGPNGITAGAVWRFDSKTGAWSDITPEKGPGAHPGGYMGLSLDRNSPATLAVSTVNRWQPGDTVWRSTDNGATWTDLKERSKRDTSTSPFLTLGGISADFGHWTAGLAIDPFDSARAAYTTGATIYMTRRFTSSASPMPWTTWVKGIEQTAIITLTSPTGGAHLVSGFGDIAGFVHDDLAVSPPHSFSNPFLSNTNTLDYAGRNPLVIVRSGSLYPSRSRDATLAWSADGGRSWQPIRTPAIRLAEDQPEKRYDLAGDAAIVTSADGRTFIACTPIPLVTRDRGKTWERAKGLHLDARPVADKVDPARFYAVDFEGNRLLASTDAGASFAPVAGTGLPPLLGPGKTRGREQPYRFVASPVAAGDVWFQVGEELYHSTNGGRSFDKASGNLRIALFGLGKPAPGSKVATIYAVGTLVAQKGVWRSTDQGRSWERINDDAHQWGLRFRVISGDPRIFGRVYVGTDGRGLLYGDAAP